MHKRMIAITLSLALTVFSFTACDKQMPEAQTTEAQTTEAAASTTTAAQTTEAAASTTAAQTEPTIAVRTAEDYAGTYGEGRCTVRIQATSDDEAEILIQWGDSAWQSVEWKMTAAYHPDSDTFTYADAVKTLVTYTDEGEETREVLSENGSGTFRMGEDKTMRWEDAEENAGEDMVFVYSPER